MGFQSTSDHIFEPPRPPKVKQPKAAKQQHTFIAPNLGLDTITEKPKAQVAVTNTMGTGGGDHRSVHSGRSVMTDPSSMPSKYRDASTGAASVSSSTSRILTPRQYSGFERSASPSSVRSTESARTPVAPVEKERPVKLKGQISTLRSMLGGLKGGKKGE
jgi:hypothetical protein